MRIGQADVYLPSPSEQTYEIHYRTEGQLRAYEDFDELYWNVTGNNWAFPIALASVTVTLPDRARILQHAAYTGPVGAQGSDFEVTELAGGLYRARTTAPLEPGEGFTIGVAWPPGLVDIGQPELREQVTSPYAELAVVAGTLVGALALLVSWLAIGRDPKRGTIYPEFEPPKGIGPAAARYIQQRGFDNRCLTAAIVSMAVKGALRIVERPTDDFREHHGYALEPLGAKAKKLTAAERESYGKLFPFEETVELKADSYYGKRVDRARVTLEAYLEGEHYGATFVYNTLYTLGAAGMGLAVTAGLLVAVWQDVPTALNQLGNWVFAGALSGLAGFLAMSLTYIPKRLVNCISLSFTQKLLAIPSAVILLVFGYTILEKALSLALDRADLVTLGSGALFGLLIAIFHVLMSASTKSGRKLLDRIEGLEMYLRMAEEDRLNLLNPPERTPQLFERLLPYAIALDLSHEWSEQFDDVLSTVERPDWYIGTGDFGLEMLDSGLDGVVAATSAPASGARYVGSSRSGGSFSGGGSGGGGGGGGGGSW